MTIVERANRSKKHMDCQQPVPLSGGRAQISPGLHDSRGIITPNASRSGGFMKYTRSNVPKLISRPANLHGASSFSFVPGPLNFLGGLDNNHSHFTILKTDVETYP